MRLKALALTPSAKVRTWGGQPQSLRVGALVVATLLLASTPAAAVAQAQGPATAQHRNPRIPFDRNGASHTSVLPFDQRFTLVNAAPAPLLRVTTWYAENEDLPASECADLNARTRIRTIIQKAVEEQLKALTVRERERVTGALNAKLSGLDAEVFNVQQRDRITAAFRDTLSKHSPPHAAQLSALGGALTTEINQLPIRSVFRSQWMRATEAAPSDTFSLDVRPLGPNRDFTFCVESVESLPAADSATHVGKVVGALRKTLREYFTEHGATVALDSTAYRKLQQSLREAVLPSADSIVTPPNSLLAPAPQLTAIQRTFVPVANAYAARCFFAGQFNAMAGTTTPPPPPPPPAPPAPGVPLPPPPPCGTAQPLTADEIPLGYAVRVLARDSGLIKLARATRVPSRMPSSDSVRVSSWAAVALTLRGLACDTIYTVVCSEAETIARGQTPLNKPSRPTDSNANIQNRSSSADLRPLAENLDSTLVRLSELRDLVNLAEGDTVLLDSLGLSVPDLAQTRQKVEHARRAAADQLSHVRNIMELLDAMDAAVAAIASGVVARDLKQVGISTTSSASYETRARWHVGQDVGVVYAFRGENTRETAPYLGVSVYLRPVNKRGDLPWFCVWDLRCTSFNLGVTTSKFEEKDRYSGVLGGIPLVVGVGTRVGDFLRVSYNAPLVYTYRFDPDGTAHRRLDRLNAFTLSLDADIREILGALGSSLFGK